MGDILHQNTSEFRGHTGHVLRRGELGYISLLLKAAEWCSMKFLPYTYSAHQLLKEPIEMQTKKLTVMEVGKGDRNRWEHNAEPRVAGQRDSVGCSNAICSSDEVKSAKILSNQILVKPPLLLSTVTDTQTGSQRCQQCSRRDAPWCAGIL